MMGASSQRCCRTLTQSFLLEGNVKFTTINLCGGDRRPRHQCWTAPTSEVTAQLTVIAFFKKSLDVKEVAQRIQQEEREERKSFHVTFEEAEFSRRFGFSEKKTSVSG